MSEDSGCSSPRLAVLGAGPVGLEAALEGVARGWDVRVYEAGEEVGHTVRGWAHVPLFTPWGMVRGPRGEEVVARTGRELAPADEMLDGAAFVRDWLEPIAEARELEARIQTGCRVLGISRRGVRKTDAVGQAARRDRPFLIHVISRRGKEWYEEAEAVFDCTGVVTRPAGFGPGGGSVPGEGAIAGHEERAGILRRIPDLEGEDRALFAGRRVLLLGAGHSAANALAALESLVADEPDTRVLWAWRNEGPPFRPAARDPLPARRELEERAAALAAHPPGWLRTFPGHTLESLFVEAGGQAARLAGQVTLRGPGGLQQVGCDILLALVGYRPDTRIFEELQVKLCHATEGPMALAASLLDAGTDDCMSQPEPDGDTLATSEPGFLVLGHKSYGRTPFFLLRDGYRQIPRAFEILEDQGIGLRVAKGAIEG